MAVSGSNPTTTPTRSAPEKASGSPVPSSPPSPWARPAPAAVARAFNDALSGLVIATFDDEEHAGLHPDGPGFHEPRDGSHDT
ncbi:hypothetical protein GCM10010140_67380 [Streptosporangium pseudovulgare]|uniref:Uncharacterized protein n=1 Tax=Streptosporangium pseudovulgare TaxID=35765 RepID=A0ABQ2RHQ7_9ACTN|nr:hypothetical protein GCM10010140_67380 [Streptosporangium pseudovulgare]